MDDAGRPGGSLERPLAHPEHDALAREVRGWFTTSAPGIGYEVSEHWFGHLGNLGPAQARVILGIDAREEVPAALASAGGATR